MDIDILEPLKLLKHVWKIRKRKGLGGWHAYGVSADATRLVLFVEPDFDLQDLIREANLAPGIVQFLDPFRSMPFQQMDTGNVARPSTPLHPGARVFATSPTGISCNGTIGGFVQLNGDNGDASVW